MRGLIPNAVMCASGSMASSLDLGVIPGSEVRMCHRRMTLYGSKSTGTGTSTSSDGHFLTKKRFFSLLPGIFTLVRR